MKNLPIIVLILTAVFGSSCAKNESEKVSIVGIWQLTTWTIQVPIDINGDMVKSTNLIDEAVCANNETLVFDDSGTVSSNMTYNPKVTVYVLNGSMDDYIFDIACDTEGTIGLSGSYSQNGSNISLFNTNAVISGNQLTITYANAIDIYNEDLTEVLETKDLTLIYIKR